MVKPFLRQRNTWGQHCSVMARAVEACQASVSQQLGVAAHAVRFHVVLPWHVATGESLTVTPTHSIEMALTGVAVLILLCPSRVYASMKLCPVFEGLEAPRPIATARA